MSEPEWIDRDAAFLGDEKHPSWRAYVAANLREALELVPDTGDWHGALRQWCAENVGDLKPNMTANEMRSVTPKTDEDAEVTAAVERFKDEYRQHFPRGGDEQDHHDATVAAIEAVVIPLLRRGPA